MNRLHRLLRLLAILALATGLLAACGNDDNGDDTDSDTPDVPADAGDPSDTDDPGDDTGSDDPPESDSPGAAGTVVVDGVSYAMDESFRCDPDIGVDMAERELDVQFLGSSSEGNITVHFSVGQIGSNPNQDFSYNGPEGVYGAFYSPLGGDQWMGEGDDTYDSEPFTVEGNSITGGGLLFDAMTMEDSIEVEVDLTFPDEIQSC